jgi:hypothetical protein
MPKQEKIYYKGQGNGLFTSGILSMGSSQATYSLSECLSECDYQYNELCCVDFHRVNTGTPNFVFIVTNMIEIVSSEESMLCLSFTVWSQCSSYLKFTIDRVRASH